MGPHEAAPGVSLRRWAAAAVASALVAAPAAACGSGTAAEPTGGSSTATTPASTAPATGPAEQQAAVEAAVGFVTDNWDAVDLHLLPIVDYVHRAHGTEAFAPAAATALERLGASAATDASIRMFDPTARVRPELLVEGRPDALLLPMATACDEPGMPAVAEDTFAEEARRGGYALTHAGLALRVMDDLGCDVPWADALRPEVLERLEEAAGASTTMDDLSIEQLVTLAWLGEVDALTPVRIDLVVAGQEPDGGWPGPDLMTRLHTTVLAIWLLEMALAGPSEEPLVPLVPGAVVPAPPTTAADTAVPTFVPDPGGG